MKLKGQGSSCMQSDAGRVRKGGSLKGPRSNNSPTKGLLTSPGSLPSAIVSSCFNHVHIILLICPLHMSVQSLMSTITPWLFIHSCLQSFAASFVSTFVCSLDQPKLSGQGFLAWSVMTKPEYITTSSGAHTRLWYL